MRVRRVGRGRLGCWVMDVNVLRERIERTGAVSAKPTSAGGARAKSGAHLVVAVNKLDTIPASRGPPVLEHGSRALAKGGGADLCHGVSCDLLLGVLRRSSEEALYPEDEWAQVTAVYGGRVDSGATVLRLDQELPYATFVDVIQFDESKRETTGLIRIFADILVERSSQKGIVIGKGGQMLKSIGSGARTELQPLLDARVYLELRVKVVPDWSKSARGLRRVGFRAQ